MGEGVGEVEWGYGVVECQWEQGHLGRSVSGSRGRSGRTGDRASSGLAPAGWDGNR